MKKFLAVAVIFLFIGVAVAPSINASVDKMSVEPKSDLCCEGSLRFKDVKPGVTRNASFAVSNIGDPGSLLDWEITNWPFWGSWTFNPPRGTNLTPEDGEVIVEVTVVFPENPNQQLQGMVKVGNCENYSDFCDIDIIISFPPIEFWYFLFGKIRSPIITNDTITFHADLVFIFWLIFPFNPIINQDIELTNHYFGYIGKRFIFAFVKACF